MAKTVKGKSGALQKPNKRNLDKQIGSTIYDDFDKFEQFFMTHWKKFCAAGVAVVLITAAWGVYEMVSHTTRSTMYSALNSAITKEELISALEKHGNAGIAANGARLRLAEMYVNENDFDSAIKLFDAVLAINTPDELKTRVLMDRAFVLERAGKTAEAAAAFADAAPKMVSPERIAEANYNAGRLYCSLGELDKARAALLLVKDAYDFNAARTGMLEPTWYGQSAYLLNRINLGDDFIPADRTPAAE